jgi:GntR family transcriptional regulator / MocR family aminotransferase
MGKGATLAIEVKREGREPIFLALSRAIIAEIERGRLKPGDPLPGTRALSCSLTLNRNTVDAAYHELIMQGWLVTEASRGTFVARDLPDFGRERQLAGPIDVADVKSVSPRRQVLRLSDGLPDPRIAPTASLGRAFRRALTSPSFLSGAYGDPRGNEVLRGALAQYLKDERGLTLSPEDILIARGSQMALFLAASAVAEPDTAIAVETPGYPLAWAAFRAAGARVIGIPVDDGGISLNSLEQVAARVPHLKAVYVTPHHQYPTTVTLGAARRLRLLDLARRFRLTIIEDDYDHEYRFDGHPVLPLAAHADRNATVIYVGSLSKILAPGIRVGYAVAPPAILRRMSDRREAVDRQGDLPLELALGELITDGTLRRHTRKARRVYHARRDHLAALLLKRFSNDSEFVLPAGGLAIWLRLKPGLGAEAWAQKAAGLGLSLLPGAHFALNATRAPEAFRLGFATLNEAEIGKAVTLLLKAKPDV